MRVQHMHGDTLSQLCDFRFDIQIIEQISSNLINNCKSYIAVLHFALFENQVLMWFIFQYC